MYDPYSIFRGKLFFLDRIIHIVFRNATQEIIRVLKEKNACKVLEVCCGSGMLSKSITKSGIEVTGVDMSETMLSAAEARHCARTLVLADALEMRFDKKFDAAVIQLAIHEMDPEVREGVLSKMKQAVKDNGIIIISDFVHTDSTSLNSRVCGYFNLKGEEQFIKTYPKHYDNYKEFMATGALKGFLKDETILSEFSCVGGHVGVITIAN